MGEKFLSKLKQPAGSTGSNIISGGLYFFVAGFILSIVGTAIGIENANDFSNIASLIASYDAMAIGFAVVMLLILSGLVLVFAFVNVKLHKAFGDKDKYDYKFNKRPAILALLITGLVWVVLVIGINGFFGEFYSDEQINILDGGTLLIALLNLRLDIVAISVVGLAVTGFLLKWTVRIIPKTTESLPDKAKII